MTELYEYLREGCTYREGELIHTSRGKLGYSAGRGYRQVRIMGGVYYLHRLIYLFQYGEMPEFIDHINGDRSDNRIENLRPATRRENGFNRKVNKDNRLGVKGVQLLPSGKYRVRLTLGGKLRCLGCYGDLELAELVSQECQDKYQGEFKRQG